MSFLPFQYANGVTPWEYLPAGAITPKVGMLLEFDANGQLVVCNESIPQYISMAEHSSAVSAGTIIPVIKIEKDTVYETQLAANVSSTLPLGTLADIDTTGLLLNGNASTDDVFRVEYVGGLTAGSTVRGKFVK
jgi:hypothetical protein